MSVDVHYIRFPVTTTELVSGTQTSHSPCKIWKPKRAKRSRDAITQLIGMEWYTCYARAYSKAAY